MDFVYYITQYSPMLDEVGMFKLVNIQFKEKVNEVFDELVSGLYIAQVTNTKLVHIRTEVAQELIDILIELYGEK